MHTYAKKKRKMKRAKKQQTKEKNWASLEPRFPTPAAATVAAYTHKRRQSQLSSLSFPHIYDKNKYP